MAEQDASCHEISINQPGRCGGGKSVVSKNQKLCLYTQRLMGPDILLPSAQVKKQKPCLGHTLLSYTQHHIHLYLRQEMQDAMSIAILIHFSLNCRLIQSMQASHSKTGITIYAKPFPVASPQTSDLVL